MHLSPFQTIDLPKVDPWFDDAETKRYLGGSEWPRELLELVARPPASARERLAWLATDEASAIGLVDVEIYSDGTASIALVVDPARRAQGYGRSILELVCDRLREHGITELRGGVHEGNDASRRLVRGAGFVQASAKPDADGFVEYVLSLTLQ